MHEANELPASGPARRPLFDLGGGQTGNVEQFAALELRKAGWDAFHVENTYWWELAALLFWDQVFARIPGTFDDQMGPYPGPLQDMPRDLFTQAFYPTRAKLIQDRLRALQDLDLAAAVRASHRAHRGTPCRMIEDWNRFTAEQLAIAPSRLPRQALLRILQRLLGDFNENRRGLPDLLATSPTGVRLVEVKGPRDSVSAPQLEWALFLSGSLGLDVDFLVVNWPQQKHGRLLNDIQAGLKGAGKRFDIDTSKARHPPKPTRTFSTESLEQHRAREAKYKPTVDQYFKLNEEFQASWSQGRFQECAASTRACFRTLPVFAEYWIQTLGRLPNPVEALTKGAQLLAAMSDRTALGEAHHIMLSNPFLRPWRDRIDTDPAQVENTERVLAAIRARPGIVQTDLKKTLGDVSYLCWILERLDRIRRTKNARTYSLSVVP